MNYFLVCYDIDDNRRRTKVATCLTRWGLRVQYSVFEVACQRDSDFRSLCEELRALAEAGDSIRLYHFTTATRERSGALDGPGMRVCPAAVVI